MALNVELLQLFTCKDLTALLQRTSCAAETIGFPYVMLRWSPTIAPEAIMASNGLSVWSNYDQRLGERGEALAMKTAASVQDGLDRWKDNTRERQIWAAEQIGMFQIVRDAPKHFHLTAYEQSLICDCGEPAWHDFVVHPLCWERDRILILDLRTPDPVTEDMVGAARKIFSVFETVYRCLHAQVVRVNSEAKTVTGGAALSQREIECLQWLAAGKTLQEAAIILDISERTLRFHVSNARERFGVATTMQAVVAAALAYGFDPNDTRRSVYAASRGALPSLKLNTG